MSARSACQRLGVGAVIVSAQNVILATGYNGPPAGAEADSCMRCERSQANAAPVADYSDCVATHAEINALLRTDRTAREGGAIYVTTAPCYQCATAIANSGLADLWYIPSNADERRNFTRSENLLRQSGVHVHRVQLEDNITLIYEVESA
jgi:dCMP deaminase